MRRFTTLALPTLVWLLGACAPLPPAPRTAEADVLKAWGPPTARRRSSLEDRFLYLPFAPKDYAAHTEELDDLFQAVADLRPLRCRYRRAKDGQEEKVTIHPYAMVLYKDAIYCVGLHVGKKEIRTFLLDRMRDTECAATERFELPPDFSIDDHFQGQFGIWRGSEPKKVVIDFDAKVADLQVGDYVRLTDRDASGKRMGQERDALLRGIVAAYGNW